MKDEIRFHPSSFCLHPSLRSPLMQSKWLWKSALKWSFPLVCGSALLVGCADSNTSTKKKSPSQKAQVAAKWNRTRANVMLGLAKDQYNTGNFESSSKTVDEANRMDDENAPLRVLSARLAIEAGQLELADKELEKARKLNPKDAEADYFSGVVNQRWQKPEAAFAFYS